MVGGSHTDVELMGRAENLGSQDQERGGVPNPKKFRFRPRASSWWLVMPTVVSRNRKGMSMIEPLCGFRLEFRAGLIT